MNERIKGMKYFRFYKSSLYKEEKTPFSPYFEVWVNLLKKLTGLKKLDSNQIYTIDQILSLPTLSATTMKAINGAKPGTFIKLSKLSSTDDLGIIRLDENQVSIFNQHQEKKRLEAEIRREVLAKLSDEEKKILGIKK